MQKPRAQRFPLRVPIHYRKAEDSSWQECTTMNISRTGILFKTSDKLPLHSALDIEVRLPLQKYLYCQGTIVRSQKSACAVRIYHCQLKPGNPL
jgi:hypothetical protein